MGKLDRFKVESRSKLIIYSIGELKKTVGKSKLKLKLVYVEM